MALHEALGFQHIGTYHDVGFKFDTWHDVGWWQRALTEDTAPPRAPISVDDLDAPLVEHALKER